MSRPAITAATLATLAAALTIDTTAHAGITAWTNAAGGNWNDAINWSAGVPNSLDTTAEISLSGAYTVTANISPVMGELQVTNPSASLAILSSLSITVASNTATDIQVINNASIVVNSNQGTSFTHLAVGDPDTTGRIGPDIGQTGEVILNVSPSNGDLADANITIYGGPHAANHTIRGKGRIAGTFINEGIFLADRLNDELRIVGDVTQASGGLVHATAGGFIGIGENGVLRGGTLITDTDGKIRFQLGTGTLAGGANNLGDIEILNGQTMRIDAGGITNSGTISVNSNQGTNFTQILVATTDPILGSGTIDLNVADLNGDLTDATLTTDAVTATNGPDHTVAGKGRVIGSWINDGLFQADRLGQELRIAATVVQSATGVIGATNSGVLGISDGGRVSGGKVVTSSGGSVQVTRGTGIVEGGLLNQGDMGVYSGQTLQIDSGGIVNDGTISINSNQGINNTQATFIDNVTISGNGSIDLNVADTNGDFNDARLLTDAGITATIGLNQAVTGKGRVSGTFINNGSINANRANQDIRLTGTINQGPAGVIMGTNSGAAVSEGVAITGGFFDSTAGGAVLAQSIGNSVSAVTNLGDAGLRNGASMSILGGGLTNDGLVSVNSDQGNNWTILTVAENATIDGDGRIELNVADFNGDLLDARLETAAGITATNATDHTIAGKGRLLGTWINQGTISGDRAAQDLRLVGTFDQTGGGVIRGDNAGSGVLFGASVIGGTFDTANGGMVLVESAPNSISGVTNLGDAGIRNGATLSLLSGGLTNLGTLTINAQPGNNWTILDIAEDATIDGTGVIDLNIADTNGDYLDARINVADGVTATQGPGHTISGKGRVTGAWINHGTFAADRPGQDLQILNADITQSSTGVIRGDNTGHIAVHNSIISNGTFASAADGSVQFASGNNTVDAVHNTGTAGIRSGAYTDLAAGGFTNDGVFTINSNAGTAWTRLAATDNATIDGTGTTYLGLSPSNGDFNDCQLGALEGFSLTLGSSQTLSGRGRLFGDLVIEGTIAPGTDDATPIEAIPAFATGTTGSLTMAASTEFHVQASAEEINDRISSSVPVHVDGTLVFTPIDGFDPPRPTRYTVITAPEYTGQFHTLVYKGTVPEGGVFRVVYEETEVIAAVTCKADIAAPIGILDLSDITFFTQLFLSGSLLVDLDGNGLLDLSDISVFIQEFLAGCG